MGNKVLVKADVTQLQTVGGGSGPSARQLFNAVRGRGTTPGSKVNVLGRAAGLAGLAGKGAALGATALNTADALQGGNIAAPLGAGYTYQGLDPTGAMTAGQIEGTVPQAPAPALTSAHVPGTATPTTSMPVSQFLTGNTAPVAVQQLQTQPQQPRVGYGANSPTLGAMPQTTSTQSAVDPATKHQDALMGVNQQTTSTQPAVDPATEHQNALMGVKNPQNHVAVTSLGMNHEAMMTAGQQQTPAPTPAVPASTPAVPASTPAVPASAPAVPAPAPAPAPVAQPPAPSTNYATFPSNSEMQLNSQSAPTPTPAPAPTPAAIKRPPPAQAPSFVQDSYKRQNAAMAPKVDPMDPMDRRMQNLYDSTGKTPPSTEKRGNLDGPSASTAQDFADRLPPTESTAVPQEAPTFAPYDPTGMTPPPLPSTPAPGYKPPVAVDNPIQSPPPAQVQPVARPSYITDMQSYGDKTLSQVPPNWAEVLEEPQHKEALQAENLRLAGIAPPLGQNQFLNPAHSANKNPDPYSMIRWDDEEKKAFTDMFFDIMGPDMLFKMSPHEVGELAAFMYIKTR